MRLITTIVILLASMLCICNPADAGGHKWKEFGYYGGYVGAANTGDNEDVYFIGATAFFHNQLVHDHPHATIEYISDWGIIGLANYHLKPESDFSVTGQVSRGLWLEKTSLLQFSTGPSWSESYGFGGSAAILFSYAFGLDKDAMNTMAIFIQSERYFSVPWRFSIGFSVGIGGLNEISD